MRRKDPRAESVSCDVVPAPTEVVNRETDFEKRRGVSRLELRKGFAQVHVSEIVGEVMRERLRLLRQVAEAGVSIDFLKLTPTGFSFVVPQGSASLVESTLRESGVSFSIKDDRSILIVHAVSIRDEEGMIAEIVRGAIGSGAQIDHIGDGHDRLLLVLSSEDARRLNKQFQVSLIDEQTPVIRSSRSA